MSSSDPIWSVVQAIHKSHQRDLPSFAAIVESVRARGDAETASVIDADARAALSGGGAVTIRRYAEAVPLGEMLESRATALHWHARSLFESGEVEDYDTALVAAEQAFASAGLPRDRRSLSPRMHLSRHWRPSPSRAARTRAVSVPWLSIVYLLAALFILAVGIGATWGTLYWKGDIATNRELRLQEVINRRDAEENARRAEDLAAQTEAMNEQCQAELQRIDEMWIRAVTRVQEIIETIEDRIADGHIVDSFEFLFVLERIVHACREHDRELVTQLSEQRLDGVIMPTLEAVYQDVEDSEAILSEVRMLLAELETAAQKGQRH